MKTNIKKQMKAVLAIAIMIMLSLTGVSCQKDSDKQDGLKKPNKIEYDGTSKGKSEDVQPADPNKDTSTNKAIDEKIKEVLSIIGDDYTIYVTYDSKEVLTFMFNKQEGFFQSVSSNKMFGMRSADENHPDTLWIYKTKFLQKQYIHKKQINIFDKNGKYSQKIIDAFLKIDTKRPVEKD